MVNIKSTKKHLLQNPAEIERNEEAAARLNLK